jgi:arylsulfatase A-like enzyme
MNQALLIVISALSWLSTSGLTASVSILHAAGPRTEKPNIVLIMADDIGQECFGCYGSRQYQTPVLDRLAATGVRFTQCYSQPLCTPSRIKLMTGQSNIRNYVSFSIMDPQEKTIGHLLQAAGYRTAVAGKWQLYGAKHYRNQAGTGILPRAAGFDQYCLWQIDRQGSRYWEPVLKENGQPVPATKSQYGPDLCTDFICRFMEQHQHQEQPFFIYYPMILVHSPFVPPPGSSGNQSRQQNFADMVVHMDRLVGKILAKLDALQLRDNTIVLFTGDNGTHRSIVSQLGERTIRGGKGLTTDAGTHVPLIVQGPGVTPAGGVCDDLIDFSDFLPTLAEWSGATVPESLTIDGVSFAPQLRGELGQKRQSAYCYYNPRPGKERFPEIRFTHDAHWKLYGDGRLFDVTRDVLEQEPISDGETPETMAARKKLQSALDSMPVKPKKIRTE